MGKKLTGILTIDDLAKMFGLPDSDRLMESNIDYGGENYMSAFREAKQEGASEEKAEEAGLAAEQGVMDEVYGQWHGAVQNAAVRLFEEHGLELRGKGRLSYEYVVAPVKSWSDVASHILTTINGVGEFEFSSLREFLDSGPYTPREAVLSHLHWIKWWPEVYGEPSARRMYEQAWR